MASKQLNTKFALKYRIANYGIPVNVKFNIKDFVRLPKPTQEGKPFRLSLERESIGINNGLLKEPISMSVIERIIDAQLIHEVINEESS